MLLFPLPHNVLQSRGLVSRGLDCMNKERKHTCNIENFEKDFSAHLEWYYMQLWSIAD